MELLIDFFSRIIAILDTLVVQFIFTLAFIVFLWGIYQYFIAGAADEEKRKQGRQFIVYSLIGFFLMFSIWGLVNILIGAAGFGGAVRPPIPFFGTEGGNGNNGNNDNGNDDNGFVPHECFGNCPTPGYSCVTDADGVNRCVFGGPIDSGGIGDFCDAPGDCDVGLQCDITINTCYEP